jgi:hypothetical protein
MSWTTTVLRIHLCSLSCLWEHKTFYKDPWLPVGCIFLHHLQAEASMRPRSQIRRQFCSQLFARSKNVSSICIMVFIRFSWRRYAKKVNQKWLTFLSYTHQYLCTDTVYTHTTWFDVKHSHIWVIWMHFQSFWNWWFQNASTQKMINCITNKTVPKKYFHWMFQVFYTC